MKILVIVNSPVHETPEGMRVKSHTGYGTFINFSLKCLTEELNHYVKLMSFFDEFPLDPARGGDGLWEPVYLNDPDIAEGLMAVVQGYDRIIVHANIPLPLRVTTDPEVSKKIIYIVHDPSHIDPMYGFEHLTLRDQEDWSVSYLFSQGRLARLQDNFRNHVGPDFVLRMQDLREYFEGQHAGFKAAHKLVVPSPQYATLLQQLDCQLNPVVIPHFSPVKASGMETAGHKPASTHVVVPVGWAKTDVFLALQVAKEMPDFTFHFVLSDEMKSVLGDIFKWFGVPKNLVFQPHREPQDFYRWCQESEVSICFHPSRIFETFGFVPYEMYDLGIKTLFLTGFSGICECVKYTDALAVTPEVKSVTSMLRFMSDDVEYQQFHNAIRDLNEPLLTLPTVKEYHERLLD